MSHEKPDYEFWDTMDEFSFNDAACLWLNFAPEPLFLPPLSQKIEALIELFRKEIAEPYALYGDARSRDRCTREQLVELAGSRGIRPPFLFPEERTPDNAIESVKQSNPDNQESGPPKVERESSLDKMQASLGVAVIALLRQAEKQGIGKYGTVEDPNFTQLAEYFFEIIHREKLSEEGYAKDYLRKKILPQAINAAKYL